MLYRYRLMINYCSEVDEGSGLDCLGCNVGLVSVLSDLAVLQIIIITSDLEACEVEDNDSSVNIKTNFII